MKLSVVVTYPEALDQPAKTVNAAASVGLLAAARLWHEKFLPMHFREGASGRYGYRKRSVKYMIRKRRRRGHSRPLVWTNQMREMLTRERQESALKNKARASIRMRGPRYLRSEGRPSAGQPDMAREIKTTIGSELQAMAKATHKAATAELNRLKDGKKRTKRLS